MKYMKKFKTKVVFTFLKGQVKTYTANSRFRGVKLGLERPIRAEVIVVNGEHKDPLVLGFINDCHNVLSPMHNVEISYEEA